jgi:release factor H-coupled RctB family protein
MEHLQQIAQTSGVADLAYLLQSLGTIGGGNHFAELQQIETPTRKARSTKSACTSWCTAARGALAAPYCASMQRFSHDGPPPAAKPQGNTCCSTMPPLTMRSSTAAASPSACCARSAPGEAVLDITHNHVLPHHWQGQDGFLHRKGATPADRGLVVIPGSRGDYSYLVRPVAGRHEALDSLAHGAGRKWARTDHGPAAAPLHAGRAAAHALRQRRGLRRPRAGLRGGPQAYKDVDSVVACLQEAGLVELVARLKPLLTYKKGAMQCC